MQQTIIITTNNNNNNANHTAALNTICAASINSPTTKQQQRWNAAVLVAVANATAFVVLWNNDSGIHTNNRTWDNTNRLFFLGSFPFVLVFRQPQAYHGRSSRWPVES